MEFIKHTNKHANAIVLAMSAVLLSGNALAVPVTVAGTTVRFTFDSDLAGLFGAPSIVGDSLSFTPTTFKTQSFNGAGFASSSQTFNIAVSAGTGYRLSAVNLTEEGDYYNLGAGAAVTVGGKLYVRDREAPLTQSVSSSIMLSQPLTAVTSMTNFETTNWTAAAGVAIPAGWGGAGGIGNGVNITIQNILLANSFMAGSAAFIEKKFVGIEVVTAPVPEPQTYALFLAGLGLVGYLARRNRRLAI